MLKIVCNFAPLKNNWSYENFRRGPRYDTDRLGALQ